MLDTRGFNPQTGDRVRVDDGKRIVEIRSEIQIKEFIHEKR
jgi:hypothetical protein